MSLLKGEIKGGGAVGVRTKSEGGKRRYFSRISRGPGRFAPCKSRILRKITCLAVYQLYYC